MPRRLFNPKSHRQRNRTQALEKAGGNLEAGMSRKKRKTPVSKRRVTVRPVYRDKPDTEALARALIHDALNRSGKNQTIDTTN